MDLTDELEADLLRVASVVSADGDQITINVTLIGFEADRAEKPRIRRSDAVHPGLREALGLKVNSKIRVVFGARIGTLLIPDLHPVQETR